MIEISQKVQKSIANGKAVVALESTIIAHGMPYPKNLQTALEIEALIREQGAEPATIGILEGVIKIGMSNEDLEIMANSESVEKVSRRDIPVVIAKKLHGATTVAATMILAEKAGIEIFVTGGIGGVHRGASQSFDISADLEELANTNVSVVCAGVKSILDIGSTLEYLETIGVPVLGYKCAEFPAFYSRNSGFEIPNSMESLADIAKIIHSKRKMELKGAVLIANPIPEMYQIEASKMEGMIELALKKARENNISGKAITPFLLSEIVHLTGGESLEANIALVKHNAWLGAQLALELTKSKS